MKRKINYIIFALILVCTSLFSISYINASDSFVYKWACIGYGDKIDLIRNGVVDPYECWHDSCQLCVKEYADHYASAHFGYCEDLTCSALGGGGAELDITPPNLIVNFPQEGFVYNSRKVLIDLDFNEPSSIYYIDNINGRGRWSRVCGGCEDDYSKSLSFDEGLNDITIKAVDRNGNFVEIRKTFYVDSKKPKILRTYPKNDFANGIFDVEFSEDNPEKLTLDYGNAAKGRKTAQVDIAKDCYLSKTKYYCSINVDLTIYDNQQISYSFELEDIAGNVQESKPIFLNVDKTVPVLTNTDFWHQGEGKYQNYIYFNMNIDERNFDEIVYTDLQESRLREIRLCSRLKNGVCEAKKSFRPGYHVLDIQINDEAGNSISKRIEFDVA